MCRQLVYYLFILYVKFYLFEEQIRLIMKLDRRGSCFSECLSFPFLFRTSAPLRRGAVLSLQFIYPSLLESPLPCVLCTANDLGDVDSFCWLFHKDTSWETVVGDFRLMAFSPTTDSATFWNGFNGGKGFWCPTQWLLFVQRAFPKWTGPC